MYAAGVQRHQHQGCPRKMGKIYSELLRRGCVCVCDFTQGDRTSQDPKEAKEVQLYMQLPPIEKMDASLSTLAACE